MAERPDISISTRSVLSRFGLTLCLRCTFLEYINLYKSIPLHTLCTLSPKLEGILTSNNSFHGCHVLCNISLDAYIPSYQLFQKSKFCNHRAHLYPSITRMKNLIHSRVIPKAINNSDTLISLSYTTQIRSQLFVPNKLCVQHSPHCMLVHKNECPININIKESINNVHSVALHSDKIARVS